MRLLFQEFQALCALPCVQIADLPTAVEKLGRLSARLGVDIWCKRDDLTGALYGGNKVRKLEWLLGDAGRKQARALLTVGARGSHHVLATAVYGKQLGFDVHAVMTPQRSTPHVEENFRRVRSLGATVHEADSYAVAPFEVAWTKFQLERRGLRTYWIPPGGSSPVGAFGYVEAGLELASQIARCELPQPAAIYVTLGSGGTVAGLAVGLAAKGLHIPIHAVRVVDAWMSSTTRLRWLVYRTVAQMRRTCPSFPAISYWANRLVHMDSTQLGAGYGLATQASEQAMGLLRDTESIHLDGTYTAKTMAALVAAAPTHRGQSVLYWHTLSGHAPLVQA